MKKAIIIDGVVANIVVVGEGFEAPEGTALVDTGAGCVIGAAYDGSTFTPPQTTQPKPIDYPLKRWQFQAMVEFLGKGAAIETAINAIPDAMQRAIAMARYKDSDIYERSDPLFAQLAPVVGLTDAEIDAAWMQIALA